MWMNGKFRDVIRDGGQVIEDRVWRSNAINEDFGRFLAAVLMRGDNGIASWGFYIAIGKTNDTDIKSRTATFKGNIESFFNKSDAPFVDDNGNWAWAKVIDSTMMSYSVLDKDIPSQVTNKLQIKVRFEQTEPDSSTRELAEFSLLARVESGNCEGIYLVNYATHGTITKSGNMSLERTVILTFPLEVKAAKESSTKIASDSLI